MHMQSLRSQRCDSARGSRSLLAGLRSSPNRRPATRRSASRRSATLDARASVEGGCGRAGGTVAGQLARDASAMQQLDALVARSDRRTIPTCASRRHACEQAAQYLVRRARSAVSLRSTSAGTGGLKVRRRRRYRAPRCRASSRPRPGSSISGVACATHAMPRRGQRTSAQADFEFARQSIAASVARRPGSPPSQLSISTAIAAEMVAVLETAARARRGSRAGRRRQRRGHGAGARQRRTTSRTRCSSSNTRATRRCARSSCCSAAIPPRRSPRAPTSSRCPAPPARRTCRWPCWSVGRIVVAAERRVAAAFNRIGEAKAARLPQITLNLNFGAYRERHPPAARRISRIRPAAPARACSRLSTGGALNAQVDIRTLQQKEALADYAGMALRALGDVENALAASESLSARVSLLSDAVSEQPRALGLTETRFRVGRADRRALEQQRLTVANARIALLERADGGAGATRQSAPGAGRQLRGASGTAGPGAALKQGLRMCPSTRMMRR